MSFCLVGCGSNKSAPVAKVTKPATPPIAEAPPQVQNESGVSFTEPKPVHAIYLTAWSAGSTRKMATIYDMAAKTEINAAVIDVRDSGEMYFNTGIPLATEAHANMHAVPHPERLMKDMAAHHMWPIARIACFRDNFVPKIRPDQAVQDPSGHPWRDRSGHYWLDPYNKKNWAYIADTVKYALKVGFPEIQMDYIRFPSEGSKSSQRYPGKASYPDKNAQEDDVIASFADYIGKIVKGAGATYSVDIFGIISSSKSDQGIGQELNKIAGPFDVLCPMVYPSHFAKGEYGIADPTAEPYEIIKKSLADFKKRVPGKRVRPWLQDFTLHVPGEPLIPYGVAEIHAQMKAGTEEGYDGYQMWNASNHYTIAAYTKPSTNPAPKKN